MNGNAELLNFIYQNSQMGVDTLNQLVEITENMDFKKHLDKELQEYTEIHETAKEMLQKNGYDEKKISTFEKMTTYLMVNMKTLTNHSTPHLAEMIINGSSMGIVDAIKNIKKYEENVEKDILNLMKKLLKFEENNVEQLKKFL